MRNHITRSLVILSFVLCSAFAAFGQVNMSADIPFDFYIKEKKFAAGKYRFTRMQHANPNSLLIVSSDETKKSSFLPGSYGEIYRGGQEQEVKLYFAKYGDEYFLTRVVNPFSEVQYRVNSGAKEKEWAALKVERSVVAIAAK